MVSRLSACYHAQQTRILLFAACFAVITNIATIVVLFQQLEHEALCDQQQEWNDFVDDHRSLGDQPPVQPELNIVNPLPKEQTTAEANVESKKPISILDVKGNDYRMHEFSSESVRASDWEHILKFNLPRDHGDITESDQCNPQKLRSHIFVNALSKWIAIQKYGYFPIYDCPEWMQNEYRPSDLVPHLYQTQCAPFWPSDVIYILSHILSPSMRSVQYGFSLSTLWLANFVEKMKVVDHRKDKLEDYMEFMDQNEFDASNLDMEWQRMSRQYVEQIGPDPGHIVDVVVMEKVPEYHEDVLKYVMSILKENDGILVINLMDEDIPDDMEQLITDLIPTQWIRYNSFVPDFLKVSIPFSQEQYLEKYNVSLWISRTTDAPC